MMSVVKQLRMRTILSALIILLIVGAGLTHEAVAAKYKQPTTDIYTLLKKLKSEGRNLSMATPAELEDLKTGGPLTMNVVKIGRSTFIINWVPVIVLLVVGLFTIVFFFTPIGLFLTRGKLSTAVGNLLITLGISRELGESLLHQEKWYKKEGSIREGFKRYMHEEFIKKYKNNITAIAFMGTAFLIAMIGLRGIKFFVAHQPDWIMYAIVVEVTVLLLLGFTTWYESEETGPDLEGFPGVNRGKELSLAEVQAKLDQLKQELEEASRLEREAMH